MNNRVIDIKEAAKESSDLCICNQPLRSRNRVSMCTGVQCCIHFNKIIINTLFEKITSFHPSFAKFKVYEP